MRSARVVVVAVAVALLLAGCADIPTSGTVQNGATEAPNGTGIVYVPNPPAQGANQREIVAGFLTAASGGKRFKVAKEYLTSAFAAKWKPTERVLVQAPQRTLTTGSGADLRVEVPISAQVDANGVYTPGSGSQPLTFHLVQQAGQWRIDSAPDGIVLSQTVFAKNYVPRPLQFFDPTWTQLVPDLRWFPSTLSSGGSGPNPASIVSELIGGPAGPISGGVTENALQGAKVESIVPTTSGVTTVALTVPGALPDTTTTGRMQQQLIQSLKLGTPTALRLVVNSTLVPVAKTLATQSPSQSAYVLTGGRFGTLSPAGRFTEAGSFGKRIAAQHPSAVTVSPRQGIAAVLTGSNQVEIVSATAQKVVDSRPALIPPTLDQRGWAYSVPTDSPDGIIASNLKGRSIPLAPSLPGSMITSIEVSPDGTRMLVLVQSAGGPRALVVGIQRTADGTPTGLTAQHYLVDLAGSAGTEGIGATWEDDGNVAVLVNATDLSTDRVWLQALGGIGSSGGEIPGASAIVGTSGLSDLRVRLSTGDIFVSNDQQQWQEESTASPKVSVLAVQR